MCYVSGITTKRITSKCVLILMAVCVSFFSTFQYISNCHWTITNLHTLPLYPLYSLSIPSMCILYNSPTTFTTPSTHTITITITITYIYNIIVVWAVQPQSSLSNIKTVIFYKCQGGYLYGQCPCEHTLKEKCFACQVLLLKKDYCNTSTLDDNGDSVDVFY